MMYEVSVTGMLHGAHNNFLELRGTIRSFFADGIIPSEKGVSGFIGP